jgi:DNA polymerase (family X)
MVTGTVNITLQHNKELAAIFRQVSDCYKYLGKEHRFRAIAYENAARTLSNMTEPVDAFGHDIKKLDELKGVGESIAEKILEYLDTGIIETFERLKKQVPQDLLALMEVEGIGPATIRTLHDKLTITSKDELIAAIASGKLDKLKGFGPKRIDNLKQVLKLDKETRPRIPLEQARQIGNTLLKEVNNIPGVINASLAGSLRREKDTIGDIDIIITALHKNHKKIINRFTRLSMVNKILASGETRASVLLHQKNMQADIRVVEVDEYGSALLYFTGSKEHNIQLRSMAKRKGWKINEYGVFDMVTGKRLAGETEEGIYKLFGLSYIPPEKRVGKDEWEHFR